METSETSKETGKITEKLTSRQDRRSQARVESVLSRIEDATYAVLRKHEKTA